MPRYHRLIPRLAGGVLIFEKSRRDPADRRGRDKAPLDAKPGRAPCARHVEPGPLDIRIAQRS